MDCIAVLLEGEEPKSVVDRLIETPVRLAWQQLQMRW
jgi:hypothetical protein